ncbi:MAG TPA: hypothetical protein VGD49_07855 [Longimicrobiales bacterium]
MKRSLLGAAARTFALVGGVIVIGAGFYVVQESALLNPCANDLRGELVSPDRRFIAAYYVRDCASSGYTTHVSIRPSDRNFDFAKDARLFNSDGACDVDVEWAERVLHIHHEPRCGAVDHTFSWRGVKIFVNGT